MPELGAISAREVRQARALLGWSQRDLAKTASLAVSTVADFERGFRSPVPNNLDAMRKAIEQAGVAFVDGDATLGPDVGRPIGARPGGMPIRFLEATDLAGEWAERRFGAQEQLPTVVTNLIRASVGLAARLKFPSGDSVQQRGWDGSCRTTEGTEFIPAGESVWEFGAQRSGIAAKANEDYEKRRKEIPPSQRRNVTFVFVTPRRWREKTKWIKGRKAERAWRDVRAYDADELVHWLELCPSVGHWLATSMGKRPSGVRQLKDLWDEWSLATRPPITIELTRAGRDEAAAIVWRWLHAPPNVLAITGESPQETLGFAYVALQDLPTDARQALIARCLFATGPDQARKLGDSLTPLYLFLQDPEPGLAISLSSLGHHVYAAYGPQTVGSETAVALTRPPRYELQRELEAMGLDSARAAQLARDAAQSLTVLRRLMPAAPGLPEPNWATADHAAVLLAALLAGAWDECSDGDRSALERLGNDNYSNLEARLVQWVGVFDGPLRKAGHLWKIASARDSWSRLAPKYLTSEHLKRFSDVAVDVLGSPDPRFELDSQDRWLASARGVQPTYSDALKVGVAESMALLAIFGIQALSVPNAPEAAEGVVRKLFLNADEERWWSLSSHLQAIAEACPGAFLDAVEASLNQNKPAVMVLFQEDEGGFAGRIYHTNLLWALEVLARSSRYLGRVARLLARIAEIDPSPKSRHANRPARSLRQIFSLFFPQTSVPQSGRLRVLEHLQKDNEAPEATWQLLLSLMPTAHVVGDFGPLPRWRDFSASEPESKPEEVTWPLVWQGADIIAGWLIESAETAPERWEQLTKAFSQFSVKRRTEMLSKLRLIAPRITIEVDRAQIWKALRELISSHRKHANSDWAVPEVELQEAEDVHRLFEPRDPIARVAWLFSDLWAKLLRPTTFQDSTNTGVEADRRESSRLRRLAIEELLTRFGGDAVFALVCTHGVIPGLVGEALADSRVDDSDKDRILIRALHSRVSPEIELAAGMIITALPRKGNPWRDALLVRARDERWPPEVVAYLLTVFPSERSLWDAVEDFGPTVEKTYWEKVHAHLPQSAPASDVEFLVEKLINNQRARSTLGILVHHRDAVRGSLLAQALEVAASQPDPGVSIEQYDTMDQYYVEEILQCLEKSSDVPDERVARIEWLYLPLLIHSRRTTLTLHKAMAVQPDVFVMVLCSLYKPDPESGVVEPPPSDAKRTEAMATRAFDLLRSWHIVPGLNGSDVDLAVLEDWVEKTRRLCRKKGRSRIGDHYIGQMLAHSPSDMDGVWPAIAIREIIRIARSQDLDNGVVQGLCNKSVPSMREPSAGGERERDLAAQYRSMARAMELEWPRVSAILEQVARSYESHGRWMDDWTEQRNW